MKNTIRSIGMGLLVLFALYMSLVKLPEMKCVRLAHTIQATYYFSATRGCQLVLENNSWLLTPGYLRRYQIKP